MKNILIGVAAAAIMGTAITVFVVSKSDDEEKNNEPDPILTSCTVLCGQTIPDLCPDFKNDNFEYNPNCEANCATWSDSLKLCIAQAAECDQLDLDFSRSAQDIDREMKGGVVGQEDAIAHSSNCTILDDDYSEIEEKEEKAETNFDCSGACYKYKQCAGFGEGVGEQGKNEAYDTCFEACQSWSQDTLNCFEKVSINGSSDCAALTMCGLSEYRDQGYLY